MTCYKPRLTCIIMKNVLEKCSCPKLKRIKILNNYVNK